MRVLVTGGAGFIGSHLVRALLARGEEIAVLDDFSTGPRTNLPSRVAAEAIDVRSRDAVRDAVGRADLVFHLAAAVGTRIVARDPAGTWTRNVEGTASVLDACAAFGTRVLLASSSEVYGPVAPRPLHEDDPSVLHPTGRRDVYALSKAAGEAYALALHRTRLLPVTVVRLFNVVGPRQSGRYGMVLPRFVAAARANEDLPVHGDGSQRRCFLHVHDAVRAFLLLAATAASEGLVVNVGSREEVRILDLAKLVLAEHDGGAGRSADPSARIRFVPLDLVHGEGFEDPQRRVPDTTRLETLTAFRPEKGLQDAIRDLLAVQVPADRVR